LYFLDYLFDLEVLVVLVDLVPLLDLHLLAHL
jgi:hypothetical protein